MRNARIEFLELVKEACSCPVCATITYVASDFNQPSTTFDLKLGHTLGEYSQFLQDLNWEYDASYGHQYVYGTIWFADNTWAERGEYDGSEWWSHQTCPAIPECCK